MFYVALVALATAGSVLTARSEIKYPWGTKPTTSHRVAEAGLIGFIVGFIYLMLGHRADTSAWGWAGLTMMLYGAVVGIFGVALAYGWFDMDEEPAVVTARQNPNRGPRAYAPQIYRP